MIRVWVEFVNIKTSNKTKIQNFSEIRKQVIWGNRYIKHNKTCICFKSWIYSNLISINDIISENGQIETESILPKFKHKKNWISEINIIKKVIPNKWKQTIQNEQSMRTKVKTSLDIYMNNKLLMSKIQIKIYTEY